MVYTEVQGARVVNPDELDKILPVRAVNEEARLVPTDTELRPIDYMPERALNIGYFLHDRIVSVACLDSDLDEPAILTVTKVATLPEYQRLGYGKAVMTEVVAAAENRGARLLRLNSRVTPVALGLYLGFGFKPKGGRVLINGVVNQPMELSLGRGQE